MKIRHLDSTFSIFILCMLFQHIHDDIIKVLWGLLLSHGPVVNLPVIGGQVDQSVIQHQLLLIHLGQKLLCKTACKQ